MATKDEIHAELREQILLLDLPPGSRLREERLAAHFEVSRTPVRQVLARLEFEGLVEQQPGSGARVSSLDPKALRDVWAIRVQLADLVGDYVRLPASVDMIDRVQAIRVDLDALRRLPAIRPLGALYNRFHEAMLDVVDNAALARILDLLYVQTARVWMQFLSEMDLIVEIDIMAEEVDATLEALPGPYGATLARVRADHMRRLLRRFNNHITRTPAVPA